MKVVAISCVRDEIDIIEAFVRHTLHFAQHLAVLDNGSSDGTLEVLHALRAEGLPLDVLHDPSLGKHQSRRMTRLMREIALEQQQADWVLPLDADEFVTSADGQPLIPEQCPADRPLTVGWRTYVPDLSDDLSELNPARRIRHCLEREAWEYVKVIVPGQLGGLEDATIAQGNHSFAVGGREIPGTAARHLVLAHFPIRTPGQFVAKTVIGYLQNELMISREPAWGFQFRDNFERLRSDPVDFIRHFAEAARTYADPTGSVSTSPPILLDPFPYQGGALRYLRPLDDAVRACQPTLDYARQLVAELGLLRASLGADARLCLEQQSLMWADVRKFLNRQDATIRECRGESMALQQQFAEAQARYEQEAAAHRECQHKLKHVEEQLEAIQERFVVDFPSTNDG